MSGTRRTFWLLLLLPSYAAHGQDRVGVPAGFAGKWVCQAPVSGYNLPVPVIPGQAPSTARMTTPPSTVIVTFTLREDGTYDAPNARGHYSFNAATKTIDWFDGLHRQQFSKTELSRRANGAPALSLILNQQRYYGCFLSKESGPGETPAAAPRQATLHQ
jgi:hypothetical protein